MWNFVNAAARGPGLLLEHDPGCHRSWPVQGPLFFLRLPHRSGCRKRLSSLAVLETPAFRARSGGALPLGILPTAFLQALGSRPLRSYSVPSSRVSCSRVTSAYRVSSGRSVARGGPCPLEVSAGLFLLELPLHQSKLGAQTAYRFPDTGVVLLD